jgi:hypothetical protein
MSIGLRCNGLNKAALETLRQKASSASRAPALSPLAGPSTITAPFMAPAEVPETA